MQFMHSKLINALVYLKLRPTRVIFRVNNVLQTFYQKELLRFVTELCFICYSCSLTILDISSFVSEMVLHTLTPKCVLSWQI